MRVNKKIKEWHQRNKWFGKNRIKTIHAVLIHDALVLAGIKPTTKKYLSLIDFHMKNLAKHKLDRITHD
jgi:hypothetical protein